MFARVLFPVFGFMLGFAASFVVERYRKKDQPSSDRTAIVLAMALQNSEERFEDAREKFMDATKIASRVVYINFANGTFLRYLNIQFGRTAIHIPIPDGTHYGPPDPVNIADNLSHAYEIGNFLIAIANGDETFRVFGPADEIYVFETPSNEAAIELFEFIVSELPPN